MRRFSKLCAVAFVLLFAQCSRASFSTIFQSATVDQSAKTVQFDLQFNQSPDFRTTDNHGDDASAFQIFIAPKHSTNGFDFFNTKSLVRGVHLGASDMLPVLDVNDGAFGDERGITHFQLDDSMVRFSAPFDLLGTQDGKFDYRVESYEYGTLTSMIDSTTAVVPLPAASYAVIPTMMMIVSGMFMRRRRAA